MEGLSKVILIGTVANPPVVYETAEETACVSFNLWVTKSTRSQWFRIFTFGNLAGRCLAITQWQQVYVEGILEINDCRDIAGSNHFALEVTATSVIPAGEDTSEIYESDMPYFEEDNYEDDEIV